MELRQTATDSSARSAFFTPEARLPDDVEVACVEEACSESGVAYIKVEYNGLSGWMKRAYLKLPEAPLEVDDEEEDEESDEESGERPFTTIHNHSQPFTTIHCLLTLSLAAIACRLVGSREALGQARG